MIPWELIGTIGGFLIQVFFANQEKKKKALENWREFVEQRQSHSERSADLREEYQRQKEELDRMKDDKPEKP